MREAEAMALLVASGVRYARRENALRAAGSALALVDDPGAFAEMLGEAGVAALTRTLDEPRRVLDALARDGLTLLLRTDAGYPTRLLQVPKPPHLLFVQGAPLLDDAFPFAIVGTRHASAYGLRHTRAIARGLAEAGMCVVSGLALGIDAAAHEGALDAPGRTVAVLGGAHDCFYPRENRPLMHRILAAGGSVISEYAPGTRPTRYSFLERNRIIAGMSLGVLVTEGARRSGALRTAQDALEAGREVFALPGSVDSEGSQLPHALLADGAHLATCAQDILSAVVVEGASLPRVVPRTRRTDDAPSSAVSLPSADAPALSAPVPAQAMSPTSELGMSPAPAEGSPEQAVCRALASGADDFDALCAATGMDSAQLASLLTMMELEGQVRALPGLRYALGAG